MITNVGKTSHKSNNIRGVVSSGAVLAVLAAIADFKTWQDFVVWAASAAGAALLLWGILEIVSTAVERASNGTKTLKGDVKFYLAQFLAFAIPLGFWGLMLAFHWAPWGIAGLIAQITAAYKLSQTIHWEETETQPGGENIDQGGPLTEPKTAAVIVPKTPTKRTGGGQDF
jgi:uncharacterized membrane protein HdeD (DUF308 family)